MSVPRHPIHRLRVDLSLLDEAREQEPQTEEEKTNWMFAYQGLLAETQALALASIAQDLHGIVKGRERLAVWTRQG